MFEYIIRRFLLMIPTFFGVTFLVFFILQIAPDGPFERAVKQLKHSEGSDSESGSDGSSSNIIDSTGELTPELLEKLRAQYGLDKPIYLRYLIWMGIWPKEYQTKIVKLNKSYRETIESVKVDKYKEYLLQRYIKVIKNTDTQSFVVIETGAGLELPIPKISNLPDNYSKLTIENLEFYQNNYLELPLNDKLIKTWYESDWEIKNVDSKNDSYTLIKTRNKGIITGYLGYSPKKGKDVSTLYSERLHISAIFGITSFLLTYLICIPLGILKAIKHGSKFDIVTSSIVFTGYSIPGYILGLVLLVYLGGEIFPLHGWRSDNFNELDLILKIKDQIWHAFLPLLAYMVGSFATMTVLMKNSLMENLSQDYVRTAFAKGLSEKRVILAHAVRNSLIPLATGIGSFIAVFFAGSFLIEKTFGIDGIGLLGFNALFERDYDIIMGGVVVGTIVGQLGNLLSDIAYAIVDPRIRFK